MKPKEVKDYAEILHELSTDYAETGKILHDSMKGVTREVGSLKKLWREKNQSRLIKIGITLMLLPDPGVSDIVGAGVIAAGLLQNKIKNSGLYLEDIYKTYPRLLKDLHSFRQESV